MSNSGPAVSRTGLDAQGLTPRHAHWNLTAAPLYEDAIRRGDGQLGAQGQLVVETGKHTGRSAKDKFFVRNAATEDAVWWGEINQPMSPANFNGLLARMRSHLSQGEVFVQDLWIGEDAAHRLPVRVVSESPWHALFARTLLIEPPLAALADFAPEFTILHAPSFTADPATDGTRSETVVAIDFEQKVVLIGGTFYAGEIKKSAFTLLNFLLPPKGVIPMHCSANIGDGGDVAIFFGLSGTGKTTLSADPARELIGDDEHGWYEGGVFNFEGGCYAKMIDLSAEAEPEIFDATHRFGAVLENVVIDSGTRALDLTDDSLTENTRGAYPVDYIANHCPANRGPEPTSVILLTADAFGVLPPVARLSPEQAMYHFLSGYTAKVAGTEIGVTEPQATFSACFGAPFMPRHPAVYGDLLRQRIAASGARCWLVNTGWTGGEYGVGKRMPIKVTRTLLNAALDGSLADAEFRTDPNFGFAVPVRVPGVPDAVMDPRGTWPDPAAYDDKARHLLSLFEKNFEKFADHVDADVQAVSLKAA